MPVDHQMRHLNHNTLVSLWIETTGDDPRKCDIVEICIMPLDNFIRPSKIMIPFYNQILPFRIENIDFKMASVGREKMQQATTHGLEPSLAADRLEEWVHKLNMPYGKRLVPIAYNWPVVREFLHTWLRFHNFNYLFSHEYRDVMSSVLFINDSWNQRNKMIDYPRPEHLAYLCHAHNISFKMSDDVMVKALKLAELYRQLIGVLPSSLVNTPVADVPFPGGTPGGT